MRSPHVDRKRVCFVIINPGLCESFNVSRLICFDFFFIIYEKLIFELVHILLLLLDVLKVQEHWRFVVNIS